MMCEQWPQEKVLRLIQAYHAHECLWKTSSRCYSDRNKKDEAWEEVARSIGCDLRGTEKKMKTLRTQFMNYYKTANRRTAESGTDEVYEPKWFAYNALKFLLETRVERAPVINREPVEIKKVKLQPLEESVSSEEDDMVVEVEGMLDESDKDYMPPKDEHQAIETHHYTSTNQSKPVTDKPSHLRKLLKPTKYRRTGPTGEDNNNGVSESTNPSSSSSPTVAHHHHHQQHPDVRRDEFSIFGEHIACRLRNIADPRARIMAQYQVNNILFEAELGQIQSSFHLHHQEAGNSD